MSRRKSKLVKLELLSGVAAACIALSGCTSSKGPAESWDQVCVDNSNIVSDPKKCEDEQRTQPSPGYSPFYHWYYMPYRPWGSGYYPIGSTVTGGSFSAPAHGATVTRGGFGATGAGHSTSS